MQAQHNLRGEEGISESLKFQESLYNRLSHPPTTTTTSTTLTTSTTSSPAPPGPALPSPSENYQADQRNVWCFGGNLNKIVEVGGKTVASIGYSNTQLESARDAVSSFFQDIKEFSIGKRMPDKGGVQAWVNDVAGEPMPIRFELTSICDHPALKAKKDACLRHSRTYFASHLQKSTEGVHCEPSTEPQCLFDTDCEVGSTCFEGSCSRRPDCYVNLYAKMGSQGEFKRLGPITYATHPMGLVVPLPWMGKEVVSVRMSQGCDEIVVVNKAACRKEDSNNYVVEGRLADVIKDVDLPSSIAKKVCQVWLHPKKHWVLRSQ